MARVEDLLVSAILQKSARKLGSAIGDETVKRLNFTSDLEGMMVVLERILPTVEDAAERRSVLEEPAPGWLRRVRAAAYAVDDTVDELQDVRPPSAASTLTRMLHCLGKRNSMGKRMEEIKGKLKVIQEESYGYASSGVAQEDGSHTWNDPSLIRKSFRDMPLDLRLCAAYLSIIPKGSLVFKHDLINQWIALHLIEPSDGFSAWQLADKYIRRLLWATFLTRTDLLSTGSWYNTVLTVNDLFHDFTVSVTGDDLISQDGVGTTYPTKYCQYATVAEYCVTPVKLASSSSIRAVYSVGCSKKVLRDDSFSFPGNLRVLHLGYSTIHKLPDSICQLRHLEYLNLQHCSALATLPESFGDLLNLCRVNLSACHGLAKLPATFGKLKNLQYLDLSLCSCFDGIDKVLSGLTDLQYLSLGQPFCYLAEHRSFLEGLKHVWSKLTKLCYLNLSKFLDPVIYYHQSEKETSEYIGCLSGLSSLEHLSLSNNIFLSDIPTSLGELSKLHTLDLSGCIRLNRVPKRIAGINSLENILVRNCRSLRSHCFVVRAHEDRVRSNILELENVSCEELEICNLEQVKPGEQVERIRLVEKQKLQKLKLCWTVGSQASSDENKLLGSLVPPLNLKCLELHGFSGVNCFPSWWTPIRRSELPDLVEVTMEDIPLIKRLPPFGALTNLRRLVLRKIPNITRIDAADMSGGNGTTAFRCLSEFTVDDMQHLQEFMFPAAIDELLLRKCPELSFGPLPPRARRLVISGCDSIMTSWRGGGGQRHGNGMEMDGPSSSSPAVIELVVESCKVTCEDDWNLLLHLHGLETLCVSRCDRLISLPQHLGDLTSLRELKIESCHQLNSLPRSLQYLSSLKSMHFTDCRSITSIPEWFRCLNSLEKLSIDRCPAIGSLPHSIDKLTNLKDLHISHCPHLTEWCQLEKNKKKLTHIHTKHDERASVSTQTTWNGSTRSHLYSLIGKRSQVGRRRWRFLLLMVARRRRLRE